MRYTAMAWMRRANMAALGGGADIMPDDWPEEDRHSEREEFAEMHGYDRYRCPTCHRSFYSDSGPHCPYHEEPDDPMSDEPFEKENNI